MTLFWLKYELLTLNFYKSIYIWKLPSSHCVMTAVPWTMLLFQQPSFNLHNTVTWHLLTY